MASKASTVDDGGPVTLAAAMIAAQQSFDRVRKNATNPHFRSQYADLATVIEALVPGLLANGVLMTQPVVRMDDGNLVLRTILTHAASGEAMASEVPLPTPTDWQKWGSALTYARRYTLLSLAGVAPEDDDGNHAQGVERQPPKQRGEVRDDARKAELARQANKPMDKAQEARDRFMKALNGCNDLGALDDLQVKLGETEKLLADRYQECAVALDAKMKAIAADMDHHDAFEQIEGRVEDERAGELGV